MSAHAREWMTTVELLDRALSFRHLGAAARIATIQPVTADAAREVEHAPCELLTGFERLMREITCYLAFVDIARERAT